MAWPFLPAFLGPFFPPAGEPGSVLGRGSSERDVCRGPLDAVLLLDRFLPRRLGVSGGAMLCVLCAQTQLLGRREVAATVRVVVVTSCNKVTEGHRPLSGGHTHHCLGLTTSHSPRGLSETPRHHTVWITAWPHNSQCLLLFTTETAGHK